MPQAEASACARGGRLTGDVAGTRAIVPAQQLLCERRALVSPRSPGHVSRSKPPPSQSVQQLWWLPVGFHFSRASV